MSGHDELIIELQECVDELTRKLEKLLDERSRLQEQLAARKTRAVNVAKTSDEHLQEDWLSGL